MPMTNLLEFAVGHHRGHYRTNEAHDHDHHDLAAGPLLGHHLGQAFILGDELGLVGHGEYLALGADGSQLFLADHARPLGRKIAPALAPGEKQSPQSWGNC
jgi:hypothetical protein